MWTPQRKCLQILTSRGGRMLQPSEPTKLHLLLIKPNSFWRWTVKCLDSIVSGMTGITCLEKHAPMSFMWVSLQVITYKLVLRQCFFFTVHFKYNILSSLKCVWNFSITWWMILWKLGKYTHPMMEEIPSLSWLEDTRSPKTDTMWSPPSQQ